MAEKNMEYMMETEDRKKKYKIGYAPGTFDLFHIGHLNLLRRSKEVSEYLIAGVMTDDLVKYFKGRYPFVPFEDRVEIVKAISYVDEVVAVDFTNTVKMDAWKLYHYDAYFSGSDHANEWAHEQAELREVGSEIVFFPYTMRTSSTRIKSQISGRHGRVYLFGSGKIGQRVLDELRAKHAPGTNPLEGWEIAGFLDNAPEKHLTRVEGVPVYRPEDLLRLEENGDASESEYAILLTMGDWEGAHRQLNGMDLNPRWICDSLKDVESKTNL